jgi:hypothetical protein
MTLVLRLWSVLSMVAVLVSPVRAAEIEVAGQSVVTLASDSKTRGGGAGAGVEVGAPFAPDLLQTGSKLVARARISGLVGAGLAWSFELGLDFRARSFHRFEPELGLHVITVGGDLIRSIDADGRLARNPLALVLVVAPLRFRLNDGWINILGVRVGPTLARSGSPPFVLSVTLFEIGRAFGGGSLVQTKVE